MKASHSLKLISYEESYNKLLLAENWLISKGIKTEGTRFKRILKNIEELIKYKNNNTLDKLIHDKGEKELGFSLLEASSFEIIYESFKSLADHELPRRELKLSIDGPFLPEEEEMGTGNVNNRNHLFELELAAKLIQKGIKINGFDDIKFKFEEINFFIQCKRIFSKKGIEQNIRKAYEQLNERMGEKDRGIIALSIEKMTKSEQTFIELNESQIEDWTTRKTGKFERANEKYWKDLLDIRIIGILIILKFPFIIKPKQLLTSGFQIDFFPLCSPVNLQYSDYDRFMALGNKLKN